MRVVYDSDPNVADVSIDSSNRNLSTNAPCWLDAARCEIPFACFDHAGEPLTLMELIVSRDQLHELREQIDLLDDGWEECFVPIEKEGE